jgi:hypothetical protein
MSLSERIAENVERIRGQLITGVVVSSTELARWVECAATLEAENARLREALSALLSSTADTSGRE